MGIEIDLTILIRRHFCINAEPGALDICIEDTLKGSIGDGDFEQGGPHADNARCVHYASRSSQHAEALV